MGWTYTALAITTTQLAEMLERPEQVGMLIEAADDIAAGYTDMTSSSVQNHLSRDYKAMLFDTEDVDRLADLNDLVRRLPTRVHLRDLVLHRQADLRHSRARRKSPRLPGAVPPGRSHRRARRGRLDHLT